MPVYARCCHPTYALMSSSVLLTDRQGYKRKVTNPDWPRFYLYNHVASCDCQLHEADEADGGLAPDGDAAGGPVPAAEADDATGDGTGGPPAARRPRPRRLRSLNRNMKPSYCRGPWLKPWNFKDGHGIQTEIQGPAASADRGGCIRGSFT